MFGSSKRIYLDYASATPVCNEAARALAREMGVYANPGGLHAEAVAAKRLLSGARESIAAHLGCKARELIFTSGLTEANNIAILGTARALEARRRSLEGTHWIVSSIEHSSVLECFSEVERMGGTVSHIEPEPNGLVSPKRLAQLLRPTSVFVSVGWGNNEIGSVQPLPAIARIIREHEKAHKTTVLLHSDAGQAPLYRSPQVHTLGVDLFSLGSGKLYGPRGIGALFLDNRAVVDGVMFGGGQERGLRAGTEEPALAAGFAAAFDVVARERDAETKRLRKLRDDLAEGILKLVPDAVINGDPKHTLPHMLNVSIRGTKTGEYLALQLDHAGIALSTKSACKEGEALSHVVLALGDARNASSSVVLTKEERAKNTLRFSLGRDTTKRDITHTLAALQKVIPH